MSKDFSEESNPENKSTSILKCVVTLRIMSWKDENCYSNQVLKIYLTFFCSSRQWYVSVQMGLCRKCSERNVNKRISIACNIVKSGHATTFTWSWKGKPTLYFICFLLYFFSWSSTSMVFMHSAQNATLQRMLFLCGAWIIYWFNLIHSSEIIY